MRVFQDQASTGQDILNKGGGRVLFFRIKGNPTQVCLGVAYSSFFRTLPHRRDRRDMAVYFGVRIQGPFIRGTLLIWIVFGV